MSGEVFQAGDGTLPRAWSLDQTWGIQRFHRQRMAEFALAPGAPLGAGRTFDS